MNKITKLGIIAAILASFLWFEPAFAYQRTITDPATNSSLSSSVIRAAFQTLENEITSLFTFTSQYATTTAATSTMPWFQLGLIASSTSHLTSFDAVTATTTSATSTNFATTWLCLDSCKNAWPTFTSTFSFPFTKLSSGEQATTTTMAFLNGFFSNASSTVNNSLLVAGSSTLQSFTGQNASTTNINVSANHISFSSVYVGSTTPVQLNVASSTLVNGASFNRATTTIQLAPWFEARQIIGATCFATSTGGVIFRIGGKTNQTATLFCDNTLHAYSFTPIQVPAFSDWLNVPIAAASNTPDRVYINVVTQKVSD